MITSSRPSFDPRTGCLRVAGARQHNLADITVEVPHGLLTVVTGVSGSGKSSLAFATIAAEAQRQLGDMFPLYVASRLPRPPQPEVDHIDGLPTAVVVDQRPLGGNARSTVGTITDTYTHLRVLFSRASEPFVGYSSAFSFNDPAGMCPTCHGLGTVTEVDVDRLVDRGRSLREGAIQFPTFAPGSVRWRRWVASNLVDNDKPLGEYTADEWEVLLHGMDIVPTAPGEDWPPSATFEGVIPKFRRLYVDRERSRVPARVRGDVDRLVTAVPCRDCGGARLHHAARLATVDGRTIHDLVTMQISDLRREVRHLEVGPLGPLTDRLAERLDALDEIGLGYLSLDRTTPTLSGGESQRIKLVRHLGSSLTGLLYVLDEPSTGLHAHDVTQLIALLYRLRDHGNTVLLVEHDPDLIRAADHVIELGPGPGARGGRVVFQGDPAQLAHAGTATAAALAARPQVRADPRTPTGDLVRATVRRHNLRDVQVEVPAGVLVAVTGVAGSGKTTLVRAALPAGPGVVHVGQASPRGTRRSTIATSTGVLDAIRDRFAQASGQPPGLFSANADGACPSCAGAGQLHVDLALLDDVTTPCEACDATGYSPQALAHAWQGRTIAEVLDLAVLDAHEHLDDDRVHVHLAPLVEVGLGYLRLGQPAPSLSGGERQRLEIARHLDTPAATYVLDEPTAGLHVTDVPRLLDVFDRLVDQGSTVVVVEHDLQLVAHADWIIDLGPGAGDDGGTLMFAGPPSGLVARGRGHTAEHLRRALA